MNRFKLAMLLFLLQLPTINYGNTLIFYTDFEPFSYMKDDKVVGFFVDIVDEAFKRMKVEYKIKVYPFKRSLENAKKGKGIVVGIYKTKRRALELTYSAPFYEDRQVIFVRHGEVFKYNKIEDLANKTIATKLGWSYGKIFDDARAKGIFRVKTGDDRDNMTRLLNGTVDAYVDNLLSGIRQAKKMEALNSVTYLSKSVTRGNLYIASKIDTNKKLIEKFNKEISAMKKDGSYKKIMSKYTPD